MHITRHPRPAALVALALAASAGGAVIASGAASASTSQSPSPAAAGGSVVAGAVAAIDRLVADDTLTRVQGDAIDQEIRDGSIDPKQLVDAGIVSDAQMRAAAHAIDQVKQADG